MTDPQSADAESTAGPLGTLIGPDDTWVLWAVILSGVAVAIWLERTYSWAARIGGPLLLLGAAMILSNLRIMPPESPVYEVVHGDLVPLALPLLLFQANVIAIIRSTGRLFVAFHIAAVGTVAGAFLATMLLQTWVPNVSEVAAIMTASYVGGGINFFAVASSFDISSNITNPLLVADNFIMASMFLALLVIAGSRWARRWYPHPHTSDAVDSRQLAAEHWKRKEISLFDIAASLAISAVIVATAKYTSSLVADWLAGSSFVQIAANPFVHITLLSTMVATMFRRMLSNIHGAEELGSFLLCVFLFVIGLPADLYIVFFQVPMMFLFCLVMALTNLLVTFAVGRLFRLHLEDLVLSVNATLGGPPSAAAMAISKGWSKLVLPSLLVGIWGYVIGTATGLMVGEIVKQW